MERVHLTEYYYYWIKYSSDRVVQCNSWYICIFSFSCFSWNEWVKRKKMNKQPFWFQCIISKRCPYLLAAASGRCLLDLWETVMSLFSAALLSVQCNIITGPQSMMACNLPTLSLSLQGVLVLLSSCIPLCRRSSRSVDRGNSIMKLVRHQPFNPWFNSYSFRLGDRPQFCVIQLDGGNQALTYCLFFDLY